MPGFSQIICYRSVGEHFLLLCGKLQSFEHNISVEVNVCI